MGKFPDRVLDLYSLGKKDGAGTRSDAPQKWLCGGFYQRLRRREDAVLSLWKHVEGTVSELRQGRGQLFGASE